MTDLATLSNESEDYQRIALAIDYLRTHHSQQPNLDTLAAYLHLSPFHFQRLFRRWAGISPKRFLQYLTVEYAKERLSATSALNASLESGLSSPSRLHELFVNVEAVTPGEFRRRGAGLQIQYGIHPSPFGECLLAVTARGICALFFAAAGGEAEMLADLRQRWQSAELIHAPAVTAPYLTRIFPKPDQQAPAQLTLFLNGTNFQLQVWRALLQIPTGALTSYGEVARQVGDVRASRAVGAAVGANPVSFLIPCHRVLRADGQAHNYRWGVTRKQAMLAWEAAITAGELETDKAENN